MPFERDGEVHNIDILEEPVVVIIPNFPGTRRRPKYQFTQKENRRQNQALRKQSVKADRARRNC